MAQPILWAGIDAGKAAHHCVAINTDGQRVLSRRVVNDEGALIDLIRAVKELADGGSVRWAIDLNSGGAAMLITLLLEDGQDLLYIPGRTVHHASGAYRGDGKTDAKDAAIIADQARMRKDLHPLRHRDKTAVDLRILCARRNDLASDRNRAINRLRAQLLEYFPALERAFDLAHRKGALILLTGYQTPNGLRRMGAARLERWLRDRGAYNASDIATRAIEAANAQRATSSDKTSPHVWWPGSHKMFSTSMSSSSTSIPRSKPSSDSTDSPTSLPACRGSGICWEPSCSRRPTAT